MGCFEALDSRSPTKISSMIPDGQIMMQCVDPEDPRIHFALVCGAKSCPPIKVRWLSTPLDG